MKTKHASNQNQFKSTSNLCLLGQAGNYISHIIISHRTTFINQDKKETKVVEHKKEALLETRHTKTVLNVVQRRF